MIILLAVFEPTPGTLVSAAKSPEITLSLSCFGFMPDNIVKASFGPIPLIVISILKVFRSIESMKPYKSSLSSLTYKYVRTLTSFPLAGNDSSPLMDILSLKPTPPTNMTACVVDFFSKIPFNSSIIKILPGLYNKYLLP